MPVCVRVPDSGKEAAVHTQSETGPELPPLAPDRFHVSSSELLSGVFVPAVCRALLLLLMISVGKREACECDAGRLVRRDADRLL